MSTLSNNPLSKHFRQPVLYLKLPSQGRWWADGAVEIPVTGEIPIYAMTARDEITMKTPDALLNGASTVHVLESCCPTIKDAWKLPLIDLDPLLIAIRIATYGKDMDFTSVCPHCGTKNEHAVDISVMLGNIVPADWSKTVDVNGLQIMLRPQTYEEYNKSNLVNFEEQRILQVVNDDTLTDEQKTEKFNTVFAKLIETGINQVSKSIAGIKLEDGAVVDNRQFITEFLDNCDRSVWESIRLRLNEIKDSTVYNQITVACDNPECGKDFVTPFVFEQTNFFA